MSTCTTPAEDAVCPANRSAESDAFATTAAESDDGVRGPPTADACGRADGPVRKEERSTARDDGTVVPGSDDGFVVWTAALDGWKKTRIERIRASSSNVELVERTWPAVVSASGATVAAAAAAVTGDDGRTESTADGSVRKDRRSTPDADRTDADAADVARAVTDDDYVLWTAALETWRHARIEKIRASSRNVELIDRTWLPSAPADDDVTAALLGCAVEPAATNAEHGDDVSPTEILVEPKPAVAETVTSDTLE